MGEIALGDIRNDHLMARSLEPRGQVPSDKTVAAKNDMSHGLDPRRSVGSE